MHINKGAHFLGIWILNLKPASWLAQYHQVNYTSLSPNGNTSSIIYLHNTVCGSVWYSWHLYNFHLLRWAIHSSRFEVLKLCACVTKLVEMGRVKNCQELLNENPLCKQRLDQPICLNCVCNIFPSVWATIKVFNRKCRSTRKITNMIIQCVPLPAEPGIEDIATKFEQEYVHCVRNEEECVCSAPNCCDTEQRSASQW